MARDDETPVDDVVEFEEPGPDEEDVEPDDLPMDEDVLDDDPVEDELDTVDREDDAKVIPLDGFDDEDGDVLLEVEEEETDREMVKEGEFVCRSCFLVKSASQLADRKNQYCRDCA